MMLYKDIAVWVRNRTFHDATCEIPVSVNFTILNRNHFKIEIQKNNHRNISCLG